MTSSPDSSLSPLDTSLTAFCLTSTESSQGLRTLNLEYPALAPALVDELWVRKSLQGSEIDYGLCSLAFGGVYAN